MTTPLNALTGIIIIVLTEIVTGYLKGNQKKKKQHSDVDDDDDDEKKTNKWKKGRK